MYAIVKTGGKQYRAEAAGLLTVEKIEGEAGTTVELTEVLLVSDGDNTRVGAPTVSGAKVLATIVKQAKAKKINGFTYKAKKNIRHRYGHRQQVTHLQVEQIVL